MNSISDFTTIINAVGEVVNNRGGQLLSYALILAAVGTLAMAVVELLKSVFMGRMWFNQWLVGMWTKDKKGLVAAVPGRNPVIAELLLLAVGGHSNPRALFDQPIEKMMGQIQSAVSLALEYPQEYPHLYEWITKVPERYWREGAYHMTKKDGENWKNNVLTVHKIRGLPAGAQLKGKELAAAQEASKARARLNNLVARKLDAFQNQSQYRWERLNQYAAAAISAIVFALGLYDSTVGGLLQSVVLALPAGVIAPFAKQLAGSLSSFGK